MSFWKASRGQKAKTQRKWSDFEGMPQGTLYSMVLYTGDDEQTNRQQKW